MHLPDLKNMEYVKQFFFFSSSPLAWKKGRERKRWDDNGGAKKTPFPNFLSLSICLFPSIVLRRRPHSSEHGRMKIIIYALEPPEHGFHKICGRNNDGERFSSCHQEKIPPNALRVAKSKKKPLYKPFFYFIKFCFPCGRNYVYVAEERRGWGEAGGGCGGLETFFRGGKGGVDIGDRRRRGEEMGKEWPREGQIRRCCHLVQDVEFRKKGRSKRSCFWRNGGKAFSFCPKWTFFAFLTLENNCFATFPAFYCFILPSTFSMLSSKGLINNTTEVQHVPQSSNVKFFFAIETLVKIFPARFQNGKTMAGSN